MKTTKHTPPAGFTPGHHLGPWLWNGNEIYTASGIPVLIVDYPSRFSISDEDKALIAAAPELLEALERALERIKSFDEDYDLDDVYCAGSAVIARATKGQP